MAHYNELVLKEYPCWTLYLHTDQYFLGRAYAWLEGDGELQRLSKLTPFERNYLWNQVLPSYESALAKLWRPDHINYAWLGNLIDQHGGHGHLHLIPRYQSSTSSRYANVRMFAGHQFADDQWGRNYAPHPALALPDTALLEIRDALRAKLST